MATMSFPPPVFTSGSLETSPTLIIAQYGSGVEGGFTLVSGSSGRRWHVINAAKACEFGHVFLAVEVVYSLSTEGWEFRGRGCFAIKKTNLGSFASMDSGIVGKNPIREISVLQYLTESGPHPNVIEVIEVLQVAGDIYTIMPYCKGGELFTALKSCPILDEGSSKVIFRDVLAGISRVHALGVCHRDISTENVLFDNNRRAKIIDFGMALIVGQPRGVSAGSENNIPPTGPCGKIRYIAPEVAMGDQPYDGFKVDVWACGIILFMMLAGFHPFGGKIPTEDERYNIIAVQGHLCALVRSWGLGISNEGDRYTSVPISGFLTPECSQRLTATFLLDQGDRLNPVMPPTRSEAATDK